MEDPKVTFLLADSTSDIIPFIDFELVFLPLYLQMYVHQLICQSIYLMFLDLSPFLFFY